MRWLPKAVPFLIAIVAFEFVLVFGIEAFRIFASPIHGLDEPAFSKLVLGIARMMGLEQAGIAKVSAAFGAVYLVIAGVFALHLASRIGAALGERLWPARAADIKVSHELLDAGMILIVCVTVVAGIPAMLAGATEIFIHNRLPLWLVGLAATLSMLERLPEAEEPLKLNFLERRLVKRWTRAPQGMLVAPAARLQPAHRWAELRAKAGMVTTPPVCVNCSGSWIRPRRG